MYIYILNIEVYYGTTRNLKKNSNNDNNISYRDFVWIPITAY